MPPTMPYVYPIVKTQNAEIYGSRMLKKSATSQVRDGRDQKFGIRSSGNLELRTLAHPASLAQQSCGGARLLSHTCGRLKSSMRK
jgi:hypothetical protein